MTPEEIAAKFEALEGKLEQTSSALENTQLENKALRQMLEKTGAEASSEPAMPTIPTDEFTVDKVKYKFVVPQFSVFDSLKRCAVRITAQDALSDKAILKQLVDMKSESIVAV